MSRFDWVGLLQAALARGVRPNDFWKLTPAELALVLGKSDGAGACTRARLEELAAAFPDGSGVDDDDG